MLVLIEGQNWFGGRFDGGNGRGERGEKGVEQLFSEILTVLLIFKESQKS
jgi:hypothetical protein